MNPRISIVIPVYNELRYLVKCVESIVYQKCVFSFEVILVDDGSNNGSEKICDQLETRFSNIHVIHKENKGLSAARITGLKAAEGDWIMFMDHDDMVSPNILDLMAPFVSDNVDIICCGRIDTDTPELVKFEEFHNNSTLTVSGKKVLDIFVEEGKQDTVTTPLWGKLYRKKFLESLEVEKFKPICPTIFFEDVLMMPIIYSKASQVVLLKSKLYIHREVPTSISRSGKLSSFYYEQIESGNILLEYCQTNKIQKYYSYQLCIYIRTLMRLYMLLPMYKQSGDLLTYDTRIKNMVSKYSYKYLMTNDKNSRTKLLFFIYKCSPFLLRKFYKLLK